MASASGRLVKAHLCCEPPSRRRDGGGSFAAAGRHQTCALSSSKLLLSGQLCFPSLVKALPQREGHGVFRVRGEHETHLESDPRLQRKELASQGEAAVKRSRPLEAEPTQSFSAILATEKCPTSTKVCSECHASKPLVDFAHTKRSVEERTDVCRACLAVVRAKRKQRELRHLALTSDAAWKAAKRCRKCGLLKEIRDYSDPDRRLHCRACESERLASRPRSTPQEGPKRCTKCGETKGADEFFLNPRSSTGLGSMCKVCDVRMTREWREQCRTAGVYVWRETKRCSRCGQEKTRADFQKNTANVDGLVGRCHACVSRDVKAWYEGRKKRAEETAGTAE